MLLFFIWIFVGVRSSQCLFWRQQSTAQSSNRARRKVFAFTELHCHLLLKALRWSLQPFFKTFCMHTAADLLRILPNLRS